MLDRLTSMRVFVHASALGSLSAASRQLGMSPAMATKHMDALEQDLGVKLLHRTTRRLNLTEAGEDYLASCRRILKEVDEADAEVAALRTQATGRLRMNIPLSFGVRYIAPLMARFSRQHPLVEVELGLTDVQTDLIQGGWDLAIRIGHLTDSSMKTRSLGNCPLRICASPAYLAAHGTPKQVADLASHNCLSYLLSSSQRKRWTFGSQGEIQIPVHGNLTANSGDALLAAAIEGQGIIYQPDFIVQDALGDGRLAELKFEHPNYNLGGLHLLFPPDRRPPAKVRAMIDFLVSVLRPEV